MKNNVNKSSELIHQATANRWSLSSHILSVVCLFVADNIRLACYMPVPVPESFTQTGLLATPTEGFLQPNGHSWGQLALKSEFLVPHS